MKSPEKSPLNSGQFEFIDDFKKQQEEFAKSLEGLPVEQERFSVPEIEKIIEIRKALDGIIQESKSGSKQPEEHLNKAIGYLDGLDAWIFKFSTGDEGQLKETDSLYYVMPNGVSLRLKRSNLVKGLEHVVQPFMECIVFDPKDNPTPTEHLKVGSTPMEYCSTEFYDAQNLDKVDEEFVSKVKKIYKDGKLHAVVKPENLYHEHPGSVINKIFWSKI